jgi:DtxR family Mn-dependent transcriptional regulator
MSAVEIFRGLWVQRRNWSPGTGACPDGVPVPRRDRCEECDSELLTELAAGDVATVSCLDADGGAMAKLASLGILPGARVRMVQRYPVYVFRLGWGEVAIDEGLASLVRVRRS